MVGRSVRLCAGACLAYLVGSVVIPSDARAADATPFELYEEGKRAYDSGDFPKAATFLARADGLRPNAAVLELAMAAARKADDPVLGMELVERAEQRGLDAAARDGRRVFAARVGLLSILCPGSTRCDARVDGATLSGQGSRWLLVGEHAVVLQSDTSAEHFSVHIEGGKTMVVRPTRVVEIIAKESRAAEATGASRPAQANTSGNGPRGSSGWFWGGVVTTGVLGAATAVSGLDTLSIRSSFRAEPFNEELSSSGAAAETRTNVLLVATIVVAAATAAVGYATFRSSERHGR